MGLGVEGGRRKMLPTTEKKKKKKATEKRARWGVKIEEETQQAPSIKTRGFGVASAPRRAVAVA